VSETEDNSAYENAKRLAEAYKEKVTALGLPPDISTLRYYVYDQLPGQPRAVVDLMLRFVSDILWRVEYKYGWRASGNNLYTVSWGSEWVMKIEVNGRLLDSQQEVLINSVCRALNQEKVR